MKLIPRYENERGKVNMGWLTSAHSFSFGDYYDENRMGFGVLRVINDDVIAGGEGFPAHPHRDMEIFTIPLKGSLSHEDSTGTHSTITRGDIQIMSAGTGVIHSEFNASQEDPVELLQIWIVPQIKNLEPRYEERRFDYFNTTNLFHTVISPDGRGGSLKIFQNAFVSIGNWDKDDTIRYELFDKHNGVYVFCIEGEISIGGFTLTKRDALEITETESFMVRLTKRTIVLFIEVPVNN